MPTADEPTAEAAFAEETSSEMARPEPAFAFGEERPAAEPKVAPTAAAPRPAAAKKPSFLDKIKLLFAGSTKKSREARQGQVAGGEETGGDAGRRRGPGRGAVRGSLVHASADTTTPRSR